MRDGVGPVVDPWWLCFAATASATCIALWAADLLVQLLAAGSAYAATAMIARHGASTPPSGRGAWGPSDR